MGDFFTKVSLGNLLHFSKDHGRDFLWRKNLFFTLDSDLNQRLALLLNDCKRPVLHVSLDLWLLEPTPNQTLGIKHGVVRIRWGLVLGGVSDEALVCFGKGDVRGRDSVSLVIGNNVNLAILVDTNTAVFRY